MPCQLSLEQREWLLQCLQPGSESELGSGACTSIASRSMFPVRTCMPWLTHVDSAASCPACRLQACLRALRPTSSESASVNGLPHEGAGLCFQAGFGAERAPICNGGTQSATLRTPTSCRPPSGLSLHSASGSQAQPADAGLDCHVVPSRLCASDCCGRRITALACVHDGCEWAGCLLAGAALGVSPRPPRQSLQQHLRAPASPQTGCLRV